MYFAENLGKQKQEGFFASVLFCPFLILSLLMPNGFCFTFLAVVCFVVVLLSCIIHYKRGFFGECLRSDSLIVGSALGRKETGKLASS